MLYAYTSDDPEVEDDNDNADRSPVDAPSGPLAPSTRLWPWRLRFGIERYAVFETEPYARTLRDPVLYQGDERLAYTTVKVKSYIDCMTLEIIPAHEFAAKPGAKGSIRVGELVYQREAAFARLRLEVRPFARFVLEFRDQRRGLTPDLKTLAKWYADMTGKNASDVRRYIPRLDQAGICKQDGTMYPIFQRADSKASRRSHLYALDQAQFHYRWKVRKQYCNASLKDKKWSELQALWRKACTGDAASASSPLPSQPAHAVALPYGGAMADAHAAQDVSFLLRA